MAGPSHGGSRPRWPSGAIGSAGLWSESLFEGRLRLPKRGGTLRRKFFEPRWMVRAANPKMPLLRSRTAAPALAHVAHVPCYALPPVTALSRPGPRTTDGPARRSSALQFRRWPATPSRARRLRRSPRTSARTTSSTSAPPTAASPCATAPWTYRWRGWATCSSRSSARARPTRCMPSRSSGR
jgi:hypothetical protein